MVFEKNKLQIKQNRFMRQQNVLKYLKTVNSQFESVGLSGERQM